MCLMLELLELLWNFYSLGVTFFLWNLWSQFFGNIYILFTLSFEFALFYPFFPNKNFQIKKIQSQKNMLVGGGGGGPNYLNRKFHQIKLFLLLKRKKCKYILTSLKKKKSYNFFPKLGN